MHAQKVFIMRNWRFLMLQIQNLSYNIDALQTIKQIYFPDKI